MPTPKFDRIAKEFMSRIGDNFETEFIIGAAMPEGEILSAADISAYVNKSLLDFFNQLWMSLELKEFIKKVPELVEPLTGELDVTTGVLSIPTGRKNFYKLIGAVTSSDVFITIEEADEYSLYKSSYLSDYEATADEPVCIQLGLDKIEFFPSSILKAKLIYIKLPLSPTDGSFLIQNGSNDSPFADHWNSKIAEIAERFYKIDRQQEQ